jgi:hypothetical protein
MHHDYVIAAMLLDTSIVLRIRINAVAIEEKEACLIRVLTFTTALAPNCATAS